MAYVISGNLDYCINQDATCERRDSGNINSSGHVQDGRCSLLSLWLVRPAILSFKLQRRAALHTSDPGPSISGSKYIPWLDELVATRLDFPSISTLGGTNRKDNSEECNT